MSTTQGGDYEITHGGTILMKGEVSNDIYHLLDMTIKASRYWKNGARNNRYLCWAADAKVHVCFRVADGCMGEVGS